MDEDVDGGDAGALRARHSSGGDLGADRGAPGGGGFRDDGGGDRDGSEPPAKPKRKRAPPGTAARRRVADANAAATDGASSGEDDAAACAAQDGGRGPASARCEARRALVAELRETCSILCMALDATQQLWASDEVAALAAGAVPQARADEKAARAILGGGARGGGKAKGKPRGGASAAALAVGGDDGGWRAPERDALRKALAVLGLARPGDVADALQQAGPASAPRRSAADVDAGTAAYLRSLEATGLDGTEGAFVARHLKLLREAAPPAEPDAEGPTWQAPQLAQARTAVRRLQLLEQLGAAVAGLEASAEAVEALRTAAAAATDEARLPRWWSYDADVALLKGVRAHGFGAYAAIRGDPSLNAPFAAAEGVARSAAHASRPKAAMTAEEEEEAAAEKAADKEVVDRSVAFPAPDTLTARVKRLTDAVVKALRCADPDADVADAEGEGAWSKRERERLLKALLAHGMPSAAAGADGPDWGPLRAAAALRRPDADVARAAAELEQEAQALAQQRGNPQRGEKHAPACRCATCASRRRRAAQRAAAAGEAPPRDASAEPMDPDAMDVDGGGDDGDGGGVVRKRFRPTAEQLLSAATARQLSDRLVLLTSLREAVAAADAGGAQALQRAAASLGRGGPSADNAPYWWRPGVHDLALARGTVSHGYGAWARIAADAALPFRVLLDTAEQKGDPLPAPSSRAVARRLRVLAQAHASPPAGDDDAEFVEAPPPPKRRRAASAGVAAATAALAAAEAHGKGRRRRAAVQQAPPPEEEEEEEEEQEAEEAYVYYVPGDDEADEAEDDDGGIHEPF